MKHHGVPATSNKLKWTEGGINLLGLVRSAARCLESPLIPRAGNLKHTPLSGGVLAGEEGTWWGWARKHKQGYRARPGLRACSPAFCWEEASFLSRTCLRMLGWMVTMQTRSSSPTLTYFNSPLSLMVLAGPRLMGRRHLSLSGPLCTWWYKGALGSGQMPKLKLQTFGLPILILIQVSPWPQEEMKRTETYRIKAITFQNLVVCLFQCQALC